MDSHSPNQTSPVPTQTSADTTPGKATSLTPALDPGENRITGQPNLSPDADSSLDPAASDPALDPAAARRADLGRRLVVSLIFGVPVMALSMVGAWQFPGWQWLVAALSLPVVIWAAWPFHRAAFHALRGGSSTMDTLVSLGVWAATLYSLWALCFTPAGHIGMRMDMSPNPFAGASSMADMGLQAQLYFETGVMITVFLLTGRWLEARAKSRAGSALRALLDLEAKTATVLVPEAPQAQSALAEVERGVGAGQLQLSWFRAETRDAASLQVGEVFLVRPGQKIPTDALVLQGESGVDESMLTGESVPVFVGPGRGVTGGTLNADGSLICRATAVGKDTRLAQITRLVTRAQAEKAPVARLADRISAVFVPMVLALAAVTFLTWWLVPGLGSAAGLGDAAGFVPAFTAGVAVLVVACPCALGLATPTALLVGSTRASQGGILLRGPAVLEAARQVNVLVMDKTGTLTSGQMQLDSVTVAEPESDRELEGGRELEGEGLYRRDSLDASRALELAAALETHSEHPIAAGLVKAATQTPTKLEVQAFRAFPGQGAGGVVEGQAVAIGKPGWLEQMGAEFPAALRQALDHAAQAGQSTVVLALGSGWSGSDSVSGIPAATAAQSTDIESPKAGQTQDDPSLREVTLAISGMTCASCVARVEKKLNRVEGVSATVNLPLEMATVMAPTQVSVDSLVKAVEKAGYGATLRSESQPGGDARVEAVSAEAASVSDVGSWSSSLVEGGLLKARIVAVFALHDPVKPEARDMVSQLHQAGIETHLLTGDQPAPGAAAARAAGITQVKSQVSPEDKIDYIRSLQSQGKSVAMVGDGVNDAAALAAADLGIALASGTDAAIGAADVTLVNPSLLAIMRAIDLSRHTLRIIKQNLGWAFGYNLILIPLAGAGWLNPMVSAAFMAASSVIVVSNSLRLRRA